MKVIKVFLCFALLMSLFGCNGNLGLYEFNGFAMDTFVNIKIHKGKNAVPQAVERLSQLEQIFSYTNPDSELSKINEKACNEPIEVSDDMAYLIQESLRISENTGGAFDVSIGSLIDLWSEGKVPDKSDIDELLPNLGYNNMEFVDNKVEFKNKSVKMHFGAIAKGYAVDEVKKVLTANGVTSAIIDIGGEIAVIGTPPFKKEWRIGVKNPENNEIAETLEIKEGAAATSGDYERFFVEDGVKYHHILDPATGYPADSELSGFSSITVMTENCAVADALATAVFVAGEYRNEFLEPMVGKCCVVGISEKGKVSHLSVFYCDVGGCSYYCVYPN